MRIVSRRRWIVGVLTLVVGAAIGSAVALATPPVGPPAGTVLARGTLPFDIKIQTVSVDGTGLKWRGKVWSSGQLPEFLAALRGVGVTDVAGWLNLHPGAANKLGLASLTTIKAPEVITYMIKYPPASSSGWHSHPGYLTATVQSGEVVRYDMHCQPVKISAGQTFFETGTHSFEVRNEGAVEAVIYATYVAPNGTPNTALRVDQPDPGCGF